MKCIPRIEKGNVRKVYWTSGTQVRVINIDDATNSTKDPEEFSLVRRCLLSTPLYVSTTGGSLKSGMYRYSYCLFNVNGSETSYSDLSQYIPLSNSAVITDPTNKNGWDFQGSSSDEDSNKGIVISISQNTTLSPYQTTFSNIRVVRVYYSTQSTIPEVSIVYEGANTSTVVVTDTGASLLGTLAYEEFATKNLNIWAKTIETKNDYLFLGNTTINNFDVTYDARAYRFNSVRQGKLFDASTGVIQWDVSTDGYSVPETYDCQNNFNLVERDNYTGNTGTIRPAYEDCKYKADGTTLGGQGINVSYRFVTHPIRAFSTTTSTYLDPSDYAYIGYQRDEIYRFGIVLYNKYGESSFVKWIGDIRMPSIKEMPIISGGYISVLGVIFTVSNLPSDITGWQIVRVPRDSKDQTVVDTGYVGHFQTMTAGNNLYFGTAANSYTPDLLTEHRPSLNASGSPYKSVLEYICGETNYNKNNSSNYNRIDIHVGVSSTTWLRTGLSKPYDNDNACLTYLYQYTVGDVVKSIKTLGTYKYNGVRDQSSEVALPSIFGPSLKVKSISNDSHSRGVKGSTLILKTYADISASDSGGNVYYPGYTLRRNHVKGYGGYSYYARNNNEYVPCSPIIPKTTSSASVYGGDTFITWCEYNRVCWYDDGDGGQSYDYDRLSQVVRMFVESKINFGYTVNPRMTTYTKYVPTSDNLENGNYNFLPMWETSGAWLFTNDGDEYFTQDFDLYTYNPTYSVMHYEGVYLPKPTYYNNTSSYPTRIFKSLKKINGELSDSWSKILVNNYKDLDSKYGDLTALNTFNNYLYAFQSTGIAVLPVEDREVVQSSNTATLAVGNGGVLERYDYISNSSGTNFENSVINTINNIYYIDDTNKKLCLLNQNGVQFLSDMKGLLSFTSSRSYYHCATLWNPKLSEIWFNVDGETVVYNESLQIFTSFLDTYFTDGIQIGNKTLCYADVDVEEYPISNMCIIDTGKHGAYNINTKWAANGVYIPISSGTSQLKFIVNPNNGVKNRFDSIEINNTASIGVSDYSSSITFTSALFKNYYQTSTVSSFNTTAKRKFRTWRLNTLRDSNIYRLHDNFMKVELTYNPASYIGYGSDIKFSVNNILTEFIPTYIR